MRNKSLLLLLSFLFFQTAFALTAKPIACPDVNILRSTPFEHAVLIPQVGWVAWRNDSFSTPQSWSFFAVKATEDERTAVDQANALLPSIETNDGPYDNNDGQYVCLCKGNGEILAATVTPTLTNNSMAASLLLHR